MSANPSPYGTNFPDSGLPPLGMIGANPETRAEDHSSVIGFLTRIFNDSIKVRNPWIENAEEDFKWYVHGAERETGLDEVVPQHIKEEVQAIVDQLTKEPPVVTISPIDTGEPPVMFLRNTPTPPLSKQQAMGAVQPSVNPYTNQVVPPVALPDDVIAIDASAVADFWQKQFDFYWERGRLSKQIRQTVFYAMVFGWMTPLFEWRQESMTPKLWNSISLRQMYLDPTADCIEEASYVGVDWIIDADKAKQMFPHLSDLIDARALTGPPRRIDGNTTPGRNVNITFQRRMMTLRVTWFRDQLAPMTPDEAIRSQMIEPRQVAVQPQAQPQQPEQNADNPAMPETQTDTGQVVDMTAEPMLRNAMYIYGTDQEVDPTHPNWPMRTVIRQLTSVEDLVADDRECPYWDIPVIHMVAIPIPYTLYGRGLPREIRSMQRARSRILTAITDHAEYERHPTRVYPQSTYDRLPASYKKHGHSKAGLDIVLPDPLFGDGKSLAVSIDPAPVSPALVEMQGILKQEISDRSAHPEISSGKPPPGVTGWQSLQILQQSASDRAGFAAQCLADAVYRLGHLLRKTLVDNLTMADILRVDRRYPAHVVQYIMQYAHDAEWQTDASVNSVSGTVKARQKTEALDKFNTRDPKTGEPVISMKTLRQRVDEDDDQEHRRWMEEMQDAAMAMAPPVPMGTPGTPPGQPPMPQHPPANNLTPPQQAA